MRPMRDSWEAFLKTNMPLLHSVGVIDSTHDLDVWTAEIFFNFGFITASIIMAKAADMDEQTSAKIAKVMGEECREFSEGGYEQLVMKIQEAINKGGDREGGRDADDRGNAEGTEADHGEAEGTPVDQSGYVDEAGSDPGERQIGP